MLIFFIFRLEVGKPIALLMSHLDVKRLIVSVKWSLHFTRPHICYFTCNLLCFSTY